MNGTLYKNESTSSIHNPLVSDFEMVGEPELYPSCPNGTDLNVYPPQDDIREDGSLPTLQNHSFVVNGTLDLRQWPANIPVTAQETMEAVVHVVLCELRSTGVCSPFVHYATNGTGENVNFGELHDGNHVDSEFVRIPVSSEDGLQHFRVNVPVRVNEAGSFSVLAQVVIFLTNETLYPTPMYMAIVANIPLTQSTQVLEFTNEPEILTTSQKTKNASYVLIGLAGSIMLFLLFQTCKHRKNQVLMLAQGQFLIAVLCFGLVGMVGSIFFNPKSDVYCNMLGIMLVLPVHVFYSIILARLWRIHAVISPLLLLTLEREQTFTTHLANLLNRATTCQNRKTLHRKVTDAQLARVVALWALPQVILQILRSVLTPSEVMIVWNEDMSKGMPVCNGIYENSVLEVLSGVLLLIQFLVMWVLARQSRDLPSLFNEASVIFDVTLVSVLILAIAAVVIAMTRGVTGSPKTQYIIGVLAALAMILNTSLKLILPKLQMVWRGETIVVTKLIADHNRTRRETLNSRTVKFDVYEVESRRINKLEADDDASDEDSIVLVLGDETEALMESAHDDNGGLQSIMESSLTAEQLAFNPEELGREEMDEEGRLQAILETSLSPEQIARIPPEETDGIDIANGASAPQRPTLSKTAPQTNQAWMHSSRRIVVSGEKPKREIATNADSQRFPMFAAALGSIRSLASDPPSALHLQHRQQSMQKFEIDYHPQVEDKIIISLAEPPTRRLLLRMIDAQRLLTQVNRTVLVGSTVPKEDWEQIRTLAVELGGVFKEDVEFAWETNDSDSIQRRPSPPTSSQKGTSRRIVRPRRHQSQAS
jgi:hypothetical protein